MRKIYFIVMTFILVFHTSLKAQIPHYIPTDGLQGWWPFNGTISDESGNERHGTNNNVSLIANRNGIADKAYSFNGTNSSILVNHPVVKYSGDFSISMWYYIHQSLNPNNANHVLFNTNPHHGITIVLNHGISPNKYSLLVASKSSAGTWDIIPNGESASQIKIQTWTNVTLVKSSNVFMLYINGVLDNSWTISGGIEAEEYKVNFGAADPVAAPFEKLYGYLDDIGIWKRALSAIEVKSIYSECKLVTNQPTDYSTQTGGTASFSVNAPSQGETYQWQQKINTMGFFNINNNSNFSGTNSSTLNISNLNTNNNQEEYRCIISTANCTETSKSAKLTVTANNGGGANISNNQASPITIYPNPVSDILKITTDLKSIGKEYIIYDFAQREVLKGKIIATDMSIYTKDLPEGSYYLSIGSDKGEKIQVCR